MIQRDGHAPCIDLPHDLNRFVYGLSRDETVSHVLRQPVMRGEVAQLSLL
jgi:hypothetical protein